jgi:hypothetical protein
LSIAGLTTALLQSKTKILETQRNRGNGAKGSRVIRFFCNPDPELAEGEGAL